MFFHKILGFFSNDLAIDLGTANTLVFVKGKGIVCNEPSVVVLRKDDKKPVAVGAEAKKMLGKTPANIIAIRPMKDGVIADFDATGEMLKYFITKVHNRRSFVSPRVIIGVPSGITQVEQRAVKDAAQVSGAREVYLIGEPMAAAVGVGLPVGEPSGNMIVDIGGGTTDVAVISLDGVVYSKAVRVGGDKMDDSIMAFIKRRYNLMIGDMTAELIKINIGSVYKTEGSEQRTMEIKGRDLISGIPKTLTINEAEIREALTEPVNVILDTIRVILENTPPELAADIVDRGIILAGGGALLKGLDQLIRQETGLPVFIADDPLSAVARGVGKMLDEIDLLRRVAINL
ncbi:MAG: rod shape-determining protein MreB [Nitrospirae bacterium]|jgi:rod shape-determining protein MreB|nr:rod shape-determining protein MreB [Nitrospirota bacterium]MBS1232559.1 rod shape-determining protein MreB [Nitrospirota bacterium]